MAVYLNCCQWFYIINNHSSFFYLKWCPFSRIISFGQAPRHRNKRSEGMNVLRLLITAANAFLMGPFNFTPHVQMPSLPVPLSLVPFAQAQCFLDPQSPYLWDETNDSALPIPWAGDTSYSEVLIGKSRLYGFEAHICHSGTVCLWASCQPLCTSVSSSAKQEWRKQ